MFNGQKHKNCREITKVTFQMSMSFYNGHLFVEKSEFNLHEMHKFITAMEEMDLSTSNCICTSFMFKMIRNVIEGIVFNRILYMRHTPVNSAYWTNKINILGK